MTLLKWQQKYKIFNRTLAEMVREKGAKCHESMISHYHKGDKTFSAVTAEAIEVVTNGEVTFKEILLRKCIKKPSA